MRELAERMIEIPGVVAVALGGSRAGDIIHPDSAGTSGSTTVTRCGADDVRALGFEGTVVESAARGRLVNGVAWLRVEDQRVDLLYRDLNVVQHWLDEAEAGRYEVDQVEGYLADMATYVLAGELAWAELLAGELPRPGFPNAAPASRSRSPTRRRHVTTSSRAGGCSPRRPPRPHRRRSPSAANGR